MRLRHVLFMHIIDLGIIAAALVLVSSTVYRSAASASELVADMFWLTLIVMLTYGFTITITEFLLLGLSGSDSWFMRFCRTALATGFVLWLYPMALQAVLWVLGYEISADVESVLLYTIIIRTIVRALLGRRWNRNNV